MAVILDDLAVILDDLLVTLDDLAVTLGRQLVMDELLLAEFNLRINPQWDYDLNNQPSNQ